MALALSPLLGSLPGRAADAPPNIARVAALEWLPIELLLALGVTPLAVADVHNYNLWVAEPKLPATVVDVGQRTEPNLELLQQLQPSLVLLSQGYGPTPQKSTHRANHELWLQRRQRQTADRRPPVAAGAGATIGHRKPRGTAPGAV